ncbi:MAG: ABC transporter ATP-binding protein [Terrimicrobiaceae bacterium]|nr:ABC transporter ATP-binding protein [Terrimicrobiaceae bacterium]
MPPCLELIEVGKTYATREGPLTALDPTSFEILEGEFASLVGPSGCGKSTLLYMIAGLEPPSSGTIYLDGRRVLRPGRERGMVFQEYTLFPWLTVEENIRFSRRLSANRNEGDLPFDADYSGHLIEIMGLAKFSRAYPRELSGGMKQRVAIARALLNRPRLLLMDEPFGALDAQTREEMQELMRLLSQRERATILFVTHDIEESLFLSDRILVLSAHPGRIVREVSVDFPKERDLDLKLATDFLSMKRDLLHLLRSNIKPAFDPALLRSKLSTVTPLTS